MPKMKIADIVNEFFVREKLNEQRVQTFVHRLDAGETLESVEVDPQTNELIDGRHRLAAYMSRGYTEIDVIFKRYKSPEERIAAALAANAGGALPPTSADIQHVIASLHARRVAWKKITEMVAEAMKCSPELIKAYIARVKEKMQRAKLNQAVAEIGEGSISIEDAATKFDIDAGLIKSTMGLKSSGVKEVNKQSTALRNILDGASRGVGARFTYIQKLVTESVITEKEAVEMVAEVNRRIQLLLKSNENWMARFGQAAQLPKAAKRHVTEVVRKRNTRAELRQPKGAAGSAALGLMGLGEG